MRQLHLDPAKVNVDGGALAEGERGELGGQGGEVGDVKLKEASAAIARLVRS